MCVKLWLAKFRPSRSRRTFSNSGLNGREGKKNVRFQRKTGHILKTVRARGKVTINH